MSNYDDFLDQEFAKETARGRQPNVISLIKELREHSTLGLKEAKDIVDDFLRRRGMRAQSALEQYGVSLSSQPGVQDYNAWLSEHIARLEAAGQKPQYISLIKDVREHTNLGLKEAKDLVDAFCTRERPDIHGGDGTGFFGNIAKMLGLE